MVLRHSKKQAIVAIKPEEITDSRIFNPPNEPKKRKRGSRNNAMNYKDVIAVTDDQEYSPSNIEEVHRHVKVSKMANDYDGDFSPGSKQLPYTGSDELVPSGKRRDKAKARGTRVAKKSKSRGRVDDQSIKENYHLNVQEGKPEPFGQPEVWAAKRQQLCETLPYYRAYESAAYTKNGILYAFMIDREVGIRDKFTDQIIISKW